VQAITTEDVWIEDTPYQVKRGGEGGGEEREESEYREEREERE
jgi:hypothetical protein